MIVQIMCVCVNYGITLKVAPQISSSLAGTAVILFFGFSKLLSPPTAVEKKQPAKKKVNRIYTRKVKYDLNISDPPWGKEASDLPQAPLSKSALSAKATYPSAVIPQ